MIIACCFILGPIGPCIVVEQPKTVFYRVHETNSVTKINFMCSEILLFIDTERKGLFPGKDARFFSKYALMGGPALEWTKKAFSNHLYLLALKISIKSWPMIGIAVIRKLLFRFKKTDPFEILPE